MRTLRHRRIGVSVVVWRYQLAAAAWWYGESDIKNNRYLVLKKPHKITRIKRIIRRALFHRRLASANRRARLSASRISRHRE